MSVLRFDPFRDFDRLAEQVLGVSAGTTRAPRFMPMDLYREGEQYVLHADLPGVDPASIDVSLDSGTLTIRAERSEQHSQQAADWIASERFTGTYMRQLSVGEGVDADGIAASYDKGVLTVRIPLAEKAKPRRIEVQADAQPQVISGNVTES